MIQFNAIIYLVKDGIIRSDTRVCEVIDIIDPEDIVNIVKPFPELFSIIQRQGALKLFKFNCGKLKNYYLMTIDGIIVAKDGNHVALIEAMNALYDQGKVNHHKIVDKENQITGHFRFANQVPLNLQGGTELVNVLDYIEKDKDGTQHVWCWVTDIELTRKTVKADMEGGRCRWHIENQTFNTLKNQGYHLEHNYGHGKHHLAMNFVCLTFLAFLVNQILEMSSHEFQKPLKKQEESGSTFGRK